jgi:hypothetical protein
MSTAAPAAPAAPVAMIPRCDNCGASVAGRYCGECGQRLEPPVHSLLHFIQVAAEDVTHADSRLWRTLWALLTQPGYLTHEFLCGRRARYLPPVRLYLVLSVVFFLWAAVSPDDTRAIQISAPDSGAPTARVTPLAGTTTSVFSPALPGESAEQRTARLCGQLLNYDGPWHEPLMRAWHKSCPRVVADNGRALVAAYIHNIPRAMFLFLPLLAAVMMLMYWRPRHYYVEHLLLLVHNHAFVFLAVLLVWPLSSLLGGIGTWARAAVVLYVPYYMFRSMRVVYGQGRGLTLAKLVPLALFYLVSGMIMFIFTLAYSALTL